jgi:SAM-dependent methyltransferase
VIGPPAHTGSDHPAVEWSDAVAPDGSPVEVFDRLPAEPAAGYVLGVVPPAADVLELGCGAGRLTRVLVAAGHSVVAVDESPAMLARVVPAADRVLADATTLELHRRFGVVLLGSYLVNHPDRGAAFLATAARHLAPDGTVVIQRYDPVWVRGGAPGEAVVGPVTITVTRLVPRGERFEAIVAYGVAGHRWEQSIEAAIVDDDDLEQLAHGVGLGVAAWLDPHRTWASLTRLPEPSDHRGGRPGYAQAET